MSLRLRHWQAGSLSLGPPGKPISPHRWASFQETEFPRGDSLGSWLTSLCPDSLDVSMMQSMVFSNHVGYILTSASNNNTETKLETLSQGDHVQMLHKNTIQLC